MPNIPKQLVAAGVCLAGHQDAISHCSRASLAGKGVKDGSHGRVSKGNSEGNYSDHSTKKNGPTHQAAHVLVTLSLQAAQFRCHGFNPGLFINWSWCFAARSGGDLASVRFLNLPALTLAAVND